MGSALRSGAVDVMKENHYEQVKAQVMQILTTCVVLLHAFE